jgi:acetyltransferase-like isoleucine patch superfamily enzyme
VVTSAASAGVRLEHDWFPRAVPANVIVGARSWIASAYSFLHYRSRMPVGLQIGRDTGLYVETQLDLGPQGHVLVGDLCTLVGPVFSTNGRVVIGDYVLISKDVVIADRPWAAPPVDDAAGAQTSADIEIDDDVWIGTRAVILAGARIGRGAIIGAAAIVQGEVPPFAIFAGNPGKVVGWNEPASEPSGRSRLTPVRP